LLRYFFVLFFYPFLLTAFHFVGFPVGIVYIHPIADTKPIRVNMANMLTRKVVSKGEFMGTCVNRLPNAVQKVNTIIAAIVCSIILVLCSIGRCCILGRGLAFLLCAVSIRVRNLVFCILA